MHDADLDLPVRDIRWHLASFPAMDAAEPIDVDDVALAAVQNPLAGPLVAALRTIRRLTARLRAVSAVLRTALTVMHQQHRQIRTLEQQNAQLRAERERRPSPERRSA